MRRAFHVLVLSVGLLSSVGGCAEPAPVGPDAETAPELFIALTRDFEGFRDWTSFAIEGAAMPVGHPPGPSFVYINALPPEGANRFPVGTILIKTIESGPVEEWAIHAMVKRGGTYAVGDGIAGWELFELRFDAEGRLGIVWRGPGPPSGMGYASPLDGGVAELVCSDCHAADWMNDSVLNPFTRLSY